MVKLKYTCILCQGATAKSIHMMIEIQLARQNDKGQQRRLDIQQVALRLMSTLSENLLHVNTVEYHT